MAESNRLTVRPGLLIVLAVLCLLLIMADAAGLFDDGGGERPAVSHSPEAVHFVHLKFAEPKGASVALDATQFDAAELRDAHLVAPVTIPFRMNAEYSVELSGIDGFPGGAVQIGIRTFPATGSLIDVISQQVLSVNIDESLQELLAVAGSLTLLYFHSHELGPVGDDPDDNPLSNERVPVDHPIVELRIERSDAGEAANAPDNSQTIMIPVRPGAVSAADNHDGSASGPSQPRD